MYRHYDDDTNGDAGDFLAMMISIVCYDRNPKVNDVVKEQALEKLMPGT